MKLVEKSWNEYWAYYWRVTQRKKIPNIADWDQNVVNLIEKSCNLSPPKRILDLGCGSGDHARLFAEKQYAVLGLDIANSLIDYASSQVTTKCESANFKQGDMRNIEYKNEFDLCTLLSGTFGFFSPNENQSLLNRISEAIVNEGYIFIMYISSHRNDLNKRTWKEIEIGYQLSEKWFEPETSTYHSNNRIIIDTGEVIVPKNEEGYHASECICCYTPTEITRMLNHAGFHNIRHYGSRHITEPDIVLDPKEIREIVIAQKQTKN
jgi:ubiquinone/menaquinone biosynthesis C-methylase UbiE